MAAPAVAFGPIDYDTYFPAVAQGQHGNNNNVCHQINNEQFKQYTNANINGTAGLALNFCSVGSGLAENGCDTALGGSRQCSITGSDLRGLKLNSSDFPSNSQSGGGISYCTAGQSINVGNSGTNQYGAIALYSTCTLTTSSTFSEYVFRSIELGGDAKLVLSAGDYWIDTLQINGSAQIELLGDARIFVRNSVGLTNGSVNQVGNNNLTLVGYNDINLNGTTNINGFVYSDARLKMNASSTINGRVTARYLEMNTDATINARSRTNQQLDLQFGKATSTSVTFERAFPSGITPLVFLMPTISSSNPSGDGPSSAFISSVSATGFSWTQRQPPSSAVAVTMSEVHWIAVTPGNYTLSNGKRLTAGTVVTNSALNMSSSTWVNQPLASGLTVRLNQLQTRNNNCWLTSISQPYNGGMQLNLDTSEVYSGSVSNRRCQPSGVNSLNDETIAYLAIEPGVGTMAIGGENVRYQFANTITHQSGTSLTQQCAYTTALTGFDNAPTFVAGKSSRNGSDGGWLRRCTLTSTLVSVVNDEDTYQDTDRTHVSEDYGFIALEKVAPVEECFTDDFSRSSLGNDWAIKVLGSSTPPSIVGNRLRITPASGNQATSSTFQRLFPAEDNLVTVEFDYFAWSPSSGAGGDGIAVILSDASVTPQPGSFGGALGYAQRNDGTSGFAGGWLGVGLDEYGNFSSGNEGKVGGPGFRAQSIALRGSAASNYSYLAGTAANLNPAIDVRSTQTAQPNHKYRIKIDSTINGQAWVSVERDVRDGRGYQALVSAFDARAKAGQGTVPEDFYLSFTGSTGGANNNHEIDNFKVCAIKSRPVGQQVHHFEFDYSSSPLTCKAETMAVRACANADCSQLFTDPVVAQLSLNPNTNGAWYVGGVNTSSLSFVNGIATASLRYNVTAPPVTIGVSSSIPSTIAGSDTLCRKGTGPLNTASCTLAFADSGFIFDVPDKLANKPTSINISAVRKSNSSLECVPVFENTTKNIGFWSSYISPSSIPSTWQQPLSIKGNVSGSTTTAIGKTEVSRTQIPLQFTNGVASLEINYPDAGRVQLDARFDGTGEDAGLLMTGSDQFVSVPAGLCVKPVDASASCPSADMSCNAYRKAGQNFGMTVQAMAWEKDGDTDFCSGNVSTPNFSDQTIKLISKVVAPSIASGGHDGVLGVTTYNHSAQTNNLNTISNQSISEVGVFQITAQASPNYLGVASSLNIPIGYSANIGRFVPDRFLVGDISVLPACGSFSYMDQPFPMSMSIKALNIGGAVTQNYFPPFSLATAKLVGENNNNGVDLQSRLSALPVKIDSWSQGVAMVDGTYRAYLNRVTPNVTTNLYQDGPFELLDIGVQLMDNDPRPNGLYSYVASPDMDAATTGNCTNCNAKKITTQTLRHGRVVMDNTYGPETEILKMPTRAEYWNGTSWVINGNDSCTIATYGLGSQVDNTGLGYNFDPDLATGQSITRTGASSAFQAGQFDLLWRALTSSGNLYRGQVTAPLEVPTWLEWYWNWNGVSPTSLSDPRASAFFGRYRGHDRIIYWREVN
ncbi:DUF6701 domain-containing protein [Shewanella xiamenensis]|uniref:DUF6701 domain-containing protein n=1 Tax=Shewanella xiamenensis TaxID=332186 RepID=UPI00313E9972